jgi:hypothetical protein
MEDVRVIANTIGELGALVVGVTTQQSRTRGDSTSRPEIARKLNMLSIVIKHTDMSAKLRAECMYEIGVLRDVK